MYSYKQHHHPARANENPAFLSSYFHCSLIGYFLGLLTATVSSEVFKAAQPALLYLVPFTLLPLLTMAYLKVRQRPLVRDVLYTLDVVAGYL